MRRVFPALLLLIAAVASPAADDLKVSQLEQDVRELQRQLRAQAQQLDSLRAQLATASGPTSPALPSQAPAPDGSATWIDAGKWQQLRVGMTELAVIGVLGIPTSMRNEGNQRVLLYAVEIGASGFLGGSVTLRDRVVAEIQKPVLK